MKYIYVILFLVVIGILFYIHYNYNKTKLERTENFTNMSANLISPSDFRERIEPSQKIGSSIGYSVVPFPNPGGSSFVLKHTKEKDADTKNFYRMEFKLTPGLHYHFRYYYSNNLPTFENIYSVQVIFLNDSASNTTISPDVNVSNSIEIGSGNWELRNINFQVPESSNGTVQIVLGGITEKSILEYFTDLYLVKTSPYLQNFSYTNNLNLFINGKNNSHNKTNLIKDLSLSGNDLIFENNILYEGNQIALNKNKGSINDAGKILESNRFSILWNVKVENMTGKQLLFQINANNKLNKGIKVFYITGTTPTDNIMEVDIRRFTYKYSVGIVQSNVNYALLYENDILELYVDGVLIEPLERINTVDEPNLGTCPDGWRLDVETGQCKAISGINNGTCLSNFDFKGYDNSGKRQWASRCGVNWTNCDVLTSGQTATETPLNCVIGDELNFESNKIIINPDLTVRGLLSYLLIYNIKLDAGTVQKIPEAINQFMNVSPMEKKPTPIWDSILESVINRKLDITGGSYDNTSSTDTANRTGLLNNSLTFIRDTIGNNYKTIGEISPANLGMGQFQPGQLCPFLENEVNSPCAKVECNTAQWANLDNIKVSAECGQYINNYCRNNTKDASCVLLRKRAIEKSALTERIEKFTDCAACNYKP